MVSMVPPSLDIVILVRSSVGSPPAVAPPGVHSGSAATDLPKPLPGPTHISRIKMTN